jgi:hypothetical protein
MYVNAQRELKSRLAELPFVTRCAWRVYLIVARLWRALERWLP